MKGRWEVGGRTSGGSPTWSSFPSPQPVFGTSTGGGRAQHRGGECNVVILQKGPNLGIHPHHTTHTWDAGTTWCPLQGIGVKGSPWLCGGLLSAPVPAGGGARYGTGRRSACPAVKCVECTSRAGAHAVCQGNRVSPRPGLVFRPSQNTRPCISLFYPLIPGLIRMFRDRRLAARLRRCGSVCHTYTPALVVQVYGILGTNAENNLAG